MGDENGKEVAFLISPDESPLEYGSTSSPSQDGDEDEDGARPVFERTFSSSSSHMGLSSLVNVNSDNIWTSVRRASHRYDFDMVPTQLRKNVTLVMDPTMESAEEGKLYFAEEAFYNRYVDTRYALSVNPDIYRRILSEVSDSVNIPCGLYFCCHGGDGAHTGVSHEDHVNISLAWFLVAIIFVCILTLDFTLTWPAGHDDDDYFE